MKTPEYIRQWNTLYVRIDPSVAKKLVKFMREVEGVEAEPDKLYNSEHFAGFMAEDVENYATGERLIEGLENFDVAEMLGLVDEEE